MRVMIFTLALLAPLTAHAETDKVSVGEPVIKAGEMGIGKVAYPVTNNTDAPLNAVVKCSLFDAKGAPLSEIGGWVKAIPARTKVVSERAYMDGEPARAECRITDITEPSG